MQYGEAVPVLAALAANRWVHDRILDVSAAMDKLTLQIVGQTLLGSEFQRDAAPLAADLWRLARWAPLLAAPMATSLERAGIPPFRRIGQAADRIEAAVLRCICHDRAAVAHAPAARSASEHPFDPDVETGAPVAPACSCAGGE